MLLPLFLLAAVGAASAFDLNCNICWAALNEVEGLLSENVTLSQIEGELTKNFCPLLPRGAPVAVCDGLVQLGLPFLVQTLLATEHVGAACQQLQWCRLPEPTHADLWPVPQYVLNLDLPPTQRWSALFVQQPQFKKDVIAIVDAVTMLMPAYVQQDVSFVGQALLSRLDAEFQGEVASIATAVGVPSAYIAIAQLAYELSDCTSIVGNVAGANDVHHWRNLDFGAGLGFTDTLRDMLVHVLVQQNGTTVFHLQTFSGFVGVLTGMKPGVFSVTINTRFLSRNPFAVWQSIIDQVLTHPKAYMPAHLTRHTLMSATSYAAAVQALATTPILGAVYYTVGGINANEGRILARSQNSLPHFVPIGSQPGALWPFVLQTNYDWWNGTVPFFDDRQDAGVNAMNHLGQANANLMGVIVNVLGLRPTLNQLTTVSVGMHVRSGTFTVLGRYCNAPCPF